MTMSLPLYLEDIEGISILHALDLPGCYSEAASEAEALGNVPAALGSYRDWLMMHGETVPELPEEFHIAERFASYTLADGYEVNALFEPERSPPNWEFLTLCLRLLGYSGSDLVATFESIPIDQRDAALAAGERTPRQILEHVTRAESWYLSHFMDIPTAVLEKHPSGSTERFEAVHAALIDWATTISVEQIGRIVTHDEEEWSVRKCLRRALWHERTHTAEIARFGGH